MNRKLAYGIGAGLLILIFILLASSDQDEGSAGGNTNDPAHRSNSSEISSGSSREVSSRSGKPMERESVGIGVSEIHKELLERNYGPELNEKERRNWLLAFFNKEGLKGVEAILQTYGRDISKKGIPKWVEKDLEETIPQSYFEGHLGTAPELIDVVGGSYYYSSTIARNISQKLVDAANPDQAAREVLESPPSRVGPIYFSHILGETSLRIGFEKMVGMIDELGATQQIKDSAYDSTFVSWVQRDPENIFVLLDSLPSNHRLVKKSPMYFARVAANAGDFETSEKWIEKIDNEEDARKMRIYLESAK